MGSNYGDSYHSYIRFPNVTIANGATISSAIITLVAYNARSGDFGVNIYAEASDDSVAPTTDVAFDALSLSSESVSWTTSDGWTGGVSYDSPDISSVIQEIVDRVGWTSGNAIGLILKDNGGGTSLRTARSRDYGSSYPVLTITYSDGTTTSDGEGTIPSPAVVGGSDGVIESLPIFALVNCYAEVPHADVDESLPVFTISATAIQSTVIAGDCTLPALTLSSTSGFQTTSELDEDLPSLTVSSTSLTGEVSEGDCDVPLFTISATLLNGGISQGVASLPFLLFTGRTINTGTASGSFPVFTINAYAHGPLLHTLDETLPLLQIVATLVQASTSFRCYVLNTENSAITEYDNFPFNSFCTFKGKHLAAGANGIMLLEGNKDLSRDINAYLNVGNNDFDLPNIKRITDAYLSMKGDGSYYLTVTSDDGVAHSYLLSATAGDRIKNLKTNVGKGKKGRFFELELSNLAGADFELYDMVLNVELLKRNV